MPGALNADTRQNPIFEDIQGVSHTLVVASDGALLAGDMTTRSNHRVTCEANGDIRITSTAGMSYIFERQNYIVEGSGQSFAQTGETVPVVFGRYRYATKVVDRNGNEFNIEYSLSNNTSDGRTASVFVVTRISDGSNRTRAVFDYEEEEATSAFARLRQVKVDGRTLKYSYRADETFTLPVYTLENVKSTGKIGEALFGVNWTYQYYPMAGTGANVRALKSVENQFGGSARYDYQFIRDKSPARTDALIAIKSKKLSGYSSAWEGEFNL